MSEENHLPGEAGSAWRVGSPLPGLQSATQPVIQLRQLIGKVPFLLLMQALLQGAGETGRPRARLPTPGSMRPGARGGRPAG